MERGRPCTFGDAAYFLELAGVYLISAHDQCRLDASTLASVTEKAEEMVDLLRPLAIG